MKTNDVFDIKKKIPLFNFNNNKIIVRNVNDDAVLMQIKVSEISFSFRDQRYAKKDVYFPPKSHGSQNSSKNTHERGVKNEVYPVNIIDSETPPTQCFN